MKNVILRIALAMMAIMAIAGCGQMSYLPRTAPAGAAKRTKPSNGDSGYLQNMAVRSKDGSGKGAVEQALQWSDRYSKIAEQLVHLQQKKQLTDEKLKNAQAERDKLRVELAQAKRELQEANGFLLEQKKQLANWKKSVTGLQSKNQQALLTIIRYQERIIQLLDGELPNDKRAAAGPAKSVPGNEISQAKDATGGATN